MMERPPIFGMMAEFGSPEEVIRAAERTREKGYTRTDAYSPFPVEGLYEALGTRKSRLPLLVLCGGIVGGLGGFFMQYYAAVFGYPLNVGGRPLNSWPSFIPITFELTILIAGLSAVIGMLFRNGLPRPYHPVFNVPGFERATTDSFFLCIEATDPIFDRQKTATFLRGLHARSVSVVDH
jgi:hypothetical protein